MISDAEFADFAIHLENIYRDELHRGPTDTFVDPLGRSRWTTDYYVLRTEGKDHETASREVNRRIREIVGLPVDPPVDPPVEPPVDPPPPPTSDLVRQVAGYVRTEGRKWSDDSGRRSFRICSWFPALRCFKDHRDASLRQLDEIREYWQGVRIFWHLGTPWWTDHNMGVDPRWPDFDNLFVAFLRECQARNIRVSMSSGDMQVLVPDGNEAHWHAHMAELAASVDQTTVGWWGVWNEGWQNAARPSPETAAAISQTIQSRYPWGAHALSDPSTGEEAAGLDAWSRPPANHTLIHGWRDFPGSIRRAFNLVYEGKGWLLNQDEPVGAGPRVYRRDDNPRHLFALYTMHLLTDQMTTFFGGHGLTAWSPENGLSRDWGFRELPRIWKDINIPEHFDGWGLRAGHRGDAAVYATTYADRGEGPERCDGVQSGNRAFFMVYGGRGNWDVRSRWNATARIWTETGLLAESNVSAGQQVLQAPSSMEAALVELEMR